MKQGIAIIIFVLVNLLGAIYRALKDAGFIALQPASLERWFDI
jgi:hypothetical protein